MQTRRLFIDALIAIAWTWVIAEEASATAARLLLDRLEHVGEIAWIVTGARHDSCAEQIRFRFVFATVTQQVAGGADLAAGVNCRT